MSFSEFLNNGLKSLIGYTALLVMLAVGYQTASSHWLIEVWQGSGTLSVLFFPIITYLLLQNLLNKHFNGKIRFLYLLTAGMLLHWLAALGVGTIIGISYQLDIDIYNTGGTNPFANKPFYHIYNGYFRWYSIFGIVSSLLAIGVLYLKIQFGKRRN